MILAKQILKANKSEAIKEIYLQSRFSYSSLNLKKERVLLALIVLTLATLSFLIIENLISSNVEISNAGISKDISTSSISFNQEKYIANTYFYQDPSSGNLTPVDTKFVPNLASLRKDYPYLMSKARYSLKVPNVINQNTPLNVQYENLSISIFPNNEANGKQEQGELISNQSQVTGKDNPSLNGKGITYKNAYGAGTSLGIIADPTDLKKVIKIDNIEALNSIFTKDQATDSVNIPFILQTQQATILSGDFGTLTQARSVSTKSSIKISNQDTVAYILPGKAWDSSGSETNITFTLAVKDDTGADGKSVTVTKQIPQQWINNAVFPIYTDADISFGSEAVFNSATSGYTSVTALDSTHVVAVYEDAGNGLFATAIVGTVSGTSISFGSESVFNSGDSLFTFVTTLDSTYVVAVYKDFDNSNYGTAVVGTVSGTSISFGSESVFNSGASHYTSVSALDSTHVVAVYEDGGNSNYGTAIVGTVSSATTTLGNGTDGSNSTIAPGASATEIDRFSLVTDTGTDTVTGMTVTLAGDSNAYANINTVDVQTTGGSSKCSATPSSNTVLLTSCGISVTTSSTEYVIKITPYSHANMPAVPGASYATTATVTSITATNTTAGTDSGSATITVDNASPSDVTSATATSGNAQVSLLWTNPTDSDFSSVIVLQKTGGVVSDTPTEGSSYSANDTIGSSTVVYSGSSTSATVTSLTNGTAYYYKIFAVDTNGNWSSGGTTPTGSPATPSSSNTVPSISTGPSDNNSSSGNKAGIGQNITFTATATDTEGDNYYLLVCNKTGSATPGTSAAPTCPSGATQLAVSDSIASAAQATAIYGVTSSDAPGAYDWYAFVCDNKASGALCSSVSTGTGSDADNDSPYWVAGGGGGGGGGGPPPLNNPTGIRINLTTVGGDDTFNFEATGKDYKDFSITTKNGSGSDLQTGLASGTYSINQVLPAGWAQSNISCNSPSNSSAGTLKLVINTTGGDSIFNFTGDTGITSVTTSSGTGQQVVSLSPGSYKIAQEIIPLSVWNNTSATCTNGTIDSIIITAGQVTTCTFLEKNIGGKQNSNNNNSSSGTLSLIHSFTGGTNDGINPWSALTLVGDKFYGMTESGGQQYGGSGTIFSLNTDGTGFKVIHSFGNVKSDGVGPLGFLTASDSKLYGMTHSGGNFGYGTIFSINTDGTGFALLHSFDQTTSPYTNSLAISGSKLYGMFNANQGGIFSINTDGTGFTIIHKFEFLSKKNGNNPYGSLVLSGNKLYGMTRDGGGATSHGTVFSINTDGTEFVILRPFSLSDGGDPRDSLTLSRNKLYGMTYRGGVQNKGVIFSMNTDGTGFALLHTFTGGTNDGANPYGSLTLDGSTLYGMTNKGGTADKGTLFSVNTYGSSFTLLHSFTTNANDGSSPFGYGYLTILNSTIYGMTYLGGSTSGAYGGVIFSFPILPLSVPGVVSAASQSTAATPMSGKIDSLPGVLPPGVVSVATPTTVTVIPGQITECYVTNEKTVVTPPPPSPTSPVIETISPTSVITGDTSLLVLTVNGQNFNQTSIIQFQGQNRVTTYVSDTKLMAVLKEVDYSIAGGYDITVTNTDTSQTSNKIQFTILPVDKVVPYITSITPNSAIQNSQSTQITVKGTGFNQTSQIQSNFASQSAVYDTYGLSQTQYVSSTELKATLIATFLSKTGAYEIIVYNQDTNTTSNTSSFVVEAKPKDLTPTIISVTPGTIQVGTNSIIVAVSGNNFLPTSIIMVNGQERPTVYISDTRLTFTLKQDDVKQESTLNVTVFNPIAMGGAQ